MRHADHGEAPNLVCMIKMIMLTGCLAVAGAVTLGAQSSTTTTTTKVETTTKTKVEIKNGKAVKVTGCVEVGSAGGYMLTNVADKSGALHRYILVSDSDDFSKVVHDRVEIDGRAGDIDHGKVEIKSETNVDGAKDTHSKTEGSAPYLGVKHMKMIATSCP